MATQFPSTKGSFGLVSETGVLTDNISWVYSQDKKQIRNDTGDIVGVAYYNESVEVNFSGFLPQSSPFTSTLAAALTLVTTPTDHLIGSVGTQTIVESVTRTYTNEEYKRIEVKAMNHPLVTA